MDKFDVTTINIIKRMTLEQRKTFFASNQRLRISLFYPNEASLYPLSLFLDALCI